MKGADGAFYASVTKKGAILLGPFKWDTEPTEEDVLETIKAKLH
jgi:hypothetical protein